VSNSLAQTSKVSETFEVSSPDTFKPTELGDLPAEWDVVRLGDVANVKYGKAKPKINGSIPAVGSGGIYDWVDEAFVDFPTLVIGRKGTAGRVWFMNKPCWPSDTTFYLDWKKPINVSFLYSYLTLNPLSGEHAKTTLPSLQRPDLENYPIPLPPLNEQRKIAHVLNTVQQAIAAQDDLITAAQEVKRSLMRRLFTYGPGPEPAPTKEIDFGDVPLHWQVMTLNECAYVQTGTAKGRKFGNNPTIEVPYLRVANVQDGYLDLSEMKHIRIRKSELNRYRLEYGDVVLTEGGDFDKLGRGFIWRGQIPNCIHQNHVFAVRANREIVSPEYLAYLVQSDYGKAYFLTVAHRTTNLASINTTKLKAFPTLIPALDEQYQIAHILQTADAKIAVEQDRRSALQGLFDSLLQELMTGKLRVNEIRLNTK
jgi:type I restriction enzyme S subunit